MGMLARGSILVHLPAAPVPGTALRISESPARNPTCVPGDFDRDGQVTATDIQAMLSALTDLKAYETAHGLSDAALVLLGDLNSDHIVTNADIQPLLDLLAGSGGGNLPSVPEPASHALAALAFAALGVFILRSRPRPQNA